MQRLQIKDILNGLAKEQIISIGGWIRTHRQSKQVSFIELSDGSCFKGLQLVVSPELEQYQKIASKLSTGASIKVTGTLQNSPAKGQVYELVVKELELLGEADPETYPLQKKGHTLDFLREQLHIRSRSNTFGAVFRVRNRASYAVHNFFQERGFLWIHTPIITSADCEGAGELFRVTTLDLNKMPKTDSGKINFKEDFFKQESYLTVSGQLEAEIFATSLTNVYTFGPTFRAENSNTTRHLAEFWMIEPEMAFCDLSGDIELAQDFVRYVLNDLINNCGEELEFFQNFYDDSKTLIKTLTDVAKAKFEILDYTETIKVLEKSGKSFEYPIRWGVDLQTEHERYLTDEYVKGPVFVTNYPKEIKSFYMRLNNDNRTVAATDLLLPRCGELIGGSQREERLDVLKARMKECGLNEQTYWWYLDLRRFGTVPHAGFGLGFERLIMYVTAMQNIRDVIACPRYPGFSDF